MIHNPTESQARSTVGKEYISWLDNNNLTWTNKLPYSNMSGWANGWFSVIYNGGNVNDLELVKERFEWVKEYDNLHSLTS